MNTWRSSILIAASVPALLGGASSGLAQKPEPMMAAQIQVRAARVEAKEELLRATDARVEKGIADLVGLLKVANDSKESKTRITRLKQDVAKALAKSVGYYRKKRDETRAALERPDLGYDPADLRKGMAALDERIERRIAQIIEMTRSLEVHKEFEKYLVEYDDDRADWRDDDRKFRRNEDWVQDRRVTNLTDQARKQVSEALAKNVAELQNRLRDLNSRLAAAEGPARTLIEEDIADVKRRLDIRLEHESALRIPTSEAASEVDLAGARELESLVKEMAGDLRTDFFDIFRLYNELLTDRRELARLRKLAEG
jgi:hypothetical protein